MNQRILAAAALWTLAGAVAAVGKDPVQDVLTRMDLAASRFQAMTARWTFVTHTDVINENATESANVVMKKTGPNAVQAVLDFTDPPGSRRTVSFSGHEARIYYPLMKTVQIYDLGKSGDQIDQFAMLGFGTSGSELARSYAVKLLGTETIGNQQAVKLALTPKSEEAKPYVTKVEMWLPEHGDPYPLQEKVYEPSGDYRLITYTDLKINPPLKSDALKLKVPSGVKVEHPQTQK